MIKLALVVKTGVRATSEHHERIRCAFFLMDYANRFISKYFALSFTSYLGSFQSTLLLLIKKSHFFYHLRDKTSDRINQVVRYSINANWDVVYSFSFRREVAM